MSQRQAPAPISFDEPAVARGTDIGRLCPTGVMGALAQMPLTEILQSMDFGKKTGRVEVCFDARTSGLVHVVEGQIVRAMAWTPEGEWTGELAFVELCRRGHGHFRIDYVRDEVERNVQRPTTFVLLEALRVIDEAKGGAAAAPAGGDTPGEPDAEWEGPWDGDGAAQDDTDGPSDPSVIDIEVDAEAPVQEHPRYRVGTSIELQLGDAEGPVRSALLEDISVGGAYLATEATLRKGDRLWLRVPTPAGVLVLHAAVAHVLDASAAASIGRGAGVGVSFAGLPDDVADSVRAYVDELARKRAQPTVGAQSERDRLLACIAESEFLVAAGDLAAAQRVLKQASGLAPSDDSVRRRLLNVNEAIDAAQANALLERALKGAPQAVELARRATQLRPVRDVLLRSLSVFARAGAHDDTADVAEQLLELDPHDEGALRTLLDANIAMQRWRVAAKAAEALVRLHPEDAQLKAQLQKVVQHARQPLI